MNELGDDVPPEKEYPLRDHNLDRKLSDANTKSANANLLSRHIQQGFIMF